MLFATFSDSHLGIVLSIFQGGIGLMAVSGIDVVLASRVDFSPCTVRLLDIANVK